MISYATVQDICGEFVNMEIELVPTTHRQNFVSDSQTVSMDIPMKMFTENGYIPTCGQVYSVSIRIYSESVRVLEIVKLDEEERKRRIALLEDLEF